MAVNNTPLPPAPIEQSIAAPGSVRGGQAAATWLTFTESAKLNGLNTQESLRDVLARIPSAKARDLDGLLPNRWAPT